MKSSRKNSLLTRRQIMAGAGMSAGAVMAGRRMAAAQRRREDLPPTAWNNFEVDLPPHRFATDLRPDSPFGINMATGPGRSNVEARLKAMQQAGIKWGRQTFGWRNIEREKGRYDLEPYESYVDSCTKHGITLFGDLTGRSGIHDPRTPEGVQAYCDLARAAVTRFRGRIDHWQIWNEPNGGFWDGTPEEYARLLAAAGKTIHGANPNAKVLAFNMAFCDVRWAERILKQIPYDCFDVVCFHPYRPPSTPEEPFDWWVFDQYVDNWYRGELSDNYYLIYKNFLEQTEELVRVVEQFGKLKPFWITEVNWNTPVCPFGTHELRQSDLLVRFYILALASRRIYKVFPWTLSDVGNQQFYMGHMVGLMRHDLTPKYAYFAHAWMARMIEGKRWVRNDVLGPDVYSVVFNDPTSGEDIVVAWATRTYAYLRINNEKGLTFYDVYGTRRFVALDPKRTASVTTPLSESPIYIVGPAGLKTEEVPNPGVST